MRIDALLTVLAACVLGTLLSAYPVPARAQCVTDPLRDAAFANGRAPDCPPQLALTIPLQSESKEIPRLTMTIVFARDDLRDTIPPWLDLGSRPSGPSFTGDQFRNMPRRSGRRFVGVFLFRERF